MLSATSKQQGYNAAFLDEIPQDLICVICSLVLRDPIQVIDCGHRFCSSCFDNMVRYSKDHLLCPIDRQPIEKERVFGDKGMTRTVNSLNVKCKNDKQGCVWKGCLGDMDSHESSCDYKTMQHGNQYAALTDLCKQLCERVQRCEENSEIKEKELAYLKYSVKEMKENFSGGEELKTLKEQVTYLKLTLKDVRDESYKRKGQITTLEDSVSKLENELKIMKRENEVITEKCTNEMELLRQKNDFLEKQIETNRGSCEKESKSYIEARETFSGEIDNLRSQLELNKEVISRRSHHDKENKNEMSGMTGEIEDFRSQVRCLENTLFRFDCARNEVEFKWIMENFNEKYAVGDEVSSPVFYTKVAGYRFQILLLWNDKQTMGVRLKLHRGKNECHGDSDLQPFMHEYTLEIFDKSGDSKKWKVSLCHIKRNTKNCFSIPPHSNEANQGYGAPNLIRAPFDNYVIDDAVYIKCTLHL